VSNNIPIRVVLAKPGLDGHDRGAKTIALGLRDAGMEVTYLGIRTTAEEIVKTAVEKDANVVALSCLAGGHNHHFPRVAELLAAEGMQDVLLIGGGIIPPEDIPELERRGFQAIFSPGTTISEVVDFIRTHVRA
jgi:methylmalonyl-CoA mutase C-terminal domain/subunit